MSISYRKADIFESLQNNQETQQRQEEMQRQQREAFDKEHFKGQEMFVLEDHPELNEFVKNLVQEAMETISGKSECYGDPEVIKVETRSYDGFSAHTNGGWYARDFSDISSMSGSGNWPSPSKVNSALQARYESCMNDAAEQFKKDKAVELTGIADEKINYHDLHEMGQGALAESLSEYENDYQREEGVLFEVGVYYYSPGNYHKSKAKTKPEMHVYGFINWESPYYRPYPKLSWDAKHTSSFTFSTLSEVKIKLKSTMDKIVAEF